MIVKTILHSESNPKDDLYPKTSIDQVNGLQDSLNSLQDSINSKLSTPNNITEDSVPVISSTGTVSAKKLSELKIYLHRINMTTTWDGLNDNKYVYLERYESNSIQYTLNTFIAKFKNKGVFSCSAGEVSTDYTGIKFEDSGSDVSMSLLDTPFLIPSGRSATINNGVTIDSFSDNVMEM